MSVRILQRKCNCGHSANATGECEECAKKQGSLQRRASAVGAPSTAPPSVHRVLATPGRPLDPATRAFFEPRFGTEFYRRPPTALGRAVQGRLEVGPTNDTFEREADGAAGRVVSASRRSPFRHDLSHVRIHADDAAAASAQEINARAYTVGNDIVFNAGQFQPETAEGRWLLAHEFTHAAQQQERAPRVQRNIFGDIFRGIARLFGSENYSEQELQDYLKALDQGHTEGHYDSDNKARAVAKAWRLGGSPYVLTAQRKALMIREMQQGYTSGSDEESILELLERSYNFELSYMFGAGGLNAKSLNSDFSGDNFTRLKSFYDRRFDGGTDALLKGVVKPVGFPIPLGIELPKLGEDLPPIDELKGAKTSWNEECVTGILCTQDKDVVDALPGLKVLKTPSVTEHIWEYDGHDWNPGVKQHAAFSNAKRKIIGFKLEENCGFAAASMVHEVRHQKQPDQGSIIDKEKDAYTFETDWMIQRGIPGYAPFRQPKEGGGEEVKAPAIEKYVVEHYAGATSVGDQIVGHDEHGQTEVRKADGTRVKRPPKKGDKHQDYEATDKELSSAPEADKSKWVCPTK